VVSTLLEVGYGYRNGRFPPGVFCSLPHHSLFVLLLHNDISLLGCLFWVERREINIWFKAMRQKQTDPSRDSLNRSKRCYLYLWLNNKATVLPQKEKIFLISKSSFSANTLGL